MPSEHRERRRLVGVLLAAGAVTLLLWLAAGFVVLGPCDACGGSGTWHVKCPECNGQGALFGQPCRKCNGSGEATQQCYTCAGRGRPFGPGGLVVRVIHLLIASGIIFLTALGLYLLAARRVICFDARELRPPTTRLVGIFALLAAAGLIAVEFVMGLLFFITGMGPEGPSRNQTANNQIALGFAVAAVVVGGIFLLAGGLTARAGARPRSNVGRAGRGAGDGRDD
jgi:hypothetical protein